MLIACQGITIYWKFNVLKAGFKDKEDMTFLIVDKYSELLEILFPPYNPRVVFFFFSLEEHGNWS